MKQEHLFSKVEEKRLDLLINFHKGSHFPCPLCGQECPIYDTREHEWWNLDFFQHEAFQHARVPRVKCKEHGVHQVQVPWAREGSGFTLLIETLLLAMVRDMPVAVAQQ